MPANPTPVRNDIFKPQYDAVVIGAGISGLTSAALLVRAGLSVCVLEMDARPGGYLAGFRRKNYRFDSAIHWLNQCGPKGFVTKIFDLIGRDHPVAPPQTRIKRLKGDHIDYLLTNNPDELKAQLIREFPHEQKGIERFFRDAWMVGRSFDQSASLFRAKETMNLVEKAIVGLKRLKFVLPFIKHIAYAGDQGVTKGLNRYFKDPRLHKLFASEQEMLACLVPIGWAYFGDFQSPPTGGSQVFPEWLCHVIAQLGSEVHYKCRVTQVITEGKTAKGVAFEHRGQHYQIQAKYVIAACDVETLYERMLPEHAIPAKFKQKLRGAELYSSSVTVSLALDCTAEELGFNEEAIYLHHENVGRDEHGGDDPEKSGISILAPSLRDKSMAPLGCGTLTLYIPARMSSHNRWMTGTDAQGNPLRGEEYEKLKQHYADVLIRRVEEKIAPGLRQHIVYCDVATPVTHWRYTGNRDGSMMGAKPGRENMQAGIAHYRTPIKNLLLGGHWADLGGGVPIAVKSGANTALMVLQADKNPAFATLRDYLDGRLDTATARKAPVWRAYSENWVRQPTPAEKKLATPAQGT